MSDSFRAQDYKPYSKIGMQS